MRTSYILKLDNEYYAGIYSGYIQTSNYEGAKRFDLREELMDHIINDYKWISEEIEEHFTEKKIIEVLVLDIDVSD